MKIRKFELSEDSVLELNEKENAQFFINMQKSVLFSLEKRELLTHLQCERCLLELEKQ